MIHSKSTRALRPFSKHMLPLLTPLIPCTKADSLQCDYRGVASEPPGSHFIWMWAFRWPTQAASSEQSWALSPFYTILCILYLVITLFILFPFYSILGHSGVLSPWPVFFLVFIDLLVEAFGVLITWLDSFYLDLVLGMLRVVRQLQMFLRQKVWMGLNQKLWIGVKDMKSSSCTQWPCSMPCQGRVAVIGPNGAGKSTMIKAGCTCHLSTFKSLGKAVLWKHVIFSSTLCQFFGGYSTKFWPL